MVTGSLPVVTASRTPLRHEHEVNHNMLWIVVSIMPDLEIKAVGGLAVVAYATFSVVFGSPLPSVDRLGYLDI